MKIFGEDNFLDKTMVEIIRESNQRVESLVIDEMTRTIRMAMPKIAVLVNKDKLKKWINLCIKLDNIEQDELIDMAVRKRFSDMALKLQEKDAEIRRLRNALYATLGGKFDEPTESD